MSKGMLIRGIIALVVLFLVVALIGYFLLPTLIVLVTIVPYLLLLFLIIFGFLYGLFRFVRGK